jgi:hypothetical protein
MSSEKATENRGKQVLVGAAIMFLVSGSMVGMLMGWRFIPGWVGESVGTVAGIMSTPFFMEASFIVLGLVIVLALNIWRRNREGDELVFLEERPDGGKQDPPQLAEESSEAADK